jgi:hypothetical protein
MGDSINEKDLLMIAGCICCNASLYLDFPACCGCSTKGKLLCLEGGCCLKLNTPAMKCMCCDIKCVTEDMCNPCCKSQAQQCCVVGAISLPTDEEVPMTCGYLGLFCYPAVGCCQTQGQLMERK